MRVDVTVVPGLLLLLTELLILAVVGYVVARGALRQTDNLLALSQGLVIGPALWGVTVSLVLHLLPGPAGALASWIIVVALGAGLAWHRRLALPIRPRTVAAYAAVALALMWIGLAGRQTLAIPDPSTHLGLTAALRAGAFPPAFPWLPGVAAPYHYGVAIFAAFLTPPFGPDLAFATELLGAFFWTGFVLVVATTILRRGRSFITLLLVLLLLTPGAWTLVWLMEAPELLRVPVPTGLPSAGFRTSLGDVYWPTVLPWAAATDATPPNIWKPLFVLAYGLTVVTLERACQTSRSWPSAITLALLVAFMGLLDEPLALMTLAMWIIFDAWQLKQTRDKKTWHTIARLTTGPTIAALLLAFEAGVITDILFGSQKTALSLAWHSDPASRRPFGTLEALPGGVGILGIGPAPIAVIAVLMGRRKQFILALSAASLIFLIAALTLQYTPAPHDITRFDGHARNLALLALLFAVPKALSHLSLNQCYAAVSMVFALVVWPTTIVLIHEIVRAIGRGIHFSNAVPTDRTPSSGLLIGTVGRYTHSSWATVKISKYVLTHVPVDARILTPHPEAMTIATGRPNAMGFTNIEHFYPVSGPDYEDAIHFLEPAALTRLQVEYVHATDDWIDNLPVNARNMLQDPQYFQRLIRDGSHALYLARPAYRSLATSPHSQSFEALRHLIPTSATVLLADELTRLDKLRVASVLLENRLLGKRPTGMHLITDIPINPPESEVPDVIIVPIDLPFGVDTSQFPIIWWNDRAVAFTSDPSLAPEVDPPPPPTPGIAVSISDVTSTAEVIEFTASFDNHSIGQWTGQDWLVTKLSDPPWSLPIQYAADGFTLAGQLWFAGQIHPTNHRAIHTYRFHPLDGTMLALKDTGEFATVDSSGNRPQSGTWALVARLRLDHLQAAVIPILKFTIYKDGSVTFENPRVTHSTILNPCPNRIRDSDSCLRMLGHIKPTENP